MKLKRIDYPTDYSLVEHDKALVDAQLDSCQKQVDEQFNPDWLKTKEHYEAIIRDMVKEHSELVGEIFREIEKIGGVERCDPDVMAYFNAYRWVDLDNWQALKQKYGVK